MPSGVYARPTPEQRFWQQVDRGLSDECWEWRGWIVGGGYGGFYVGLVNGQSRNTMAHRFSYQLLVGPIPEGLTLDHLCRNRVCVNPAHLEPVTMAENILRGKSPWAERARQTHCVHGHEFTEANTYRSPKRPQWRICRACVRQGNRDYYRRTKAKRAVA